MLKHIIIRISASVTFYSSINQAIICFQKTKNSVPHVLESFWPIIMVAVAVASQWFFCDLAFEKAGWAFWSISPYFCLQCTRTNLKKCSMSRINSFEDIHLSYVIYFTILIFPLNKIFSLGLDEVSLYYGIFAWGMVTYLWYISTII